MKTIRINRQRWFRPPANNNSTNLLGTPDNCCVLGHIYQKVTKHKKFPKSKNSIYSYLRRKFNPEFSVSMWMVNDDRGMGDTKREKMLKSIASQVGLKLEFYN